MPHIHFILVEPAVPENIGAAARAIKTMGFASLHLVNPVDHLHEKAQWLAHASQDILENASLFATLSDATADIDLIIGTSAKKRRVRYDYYELHELFGIIDSKKGSITNVAVVFGREESGLTNDEMQLCDIMSYVPMAVKYPSLNLAQAVMLYAYTLSPFSKDQIQSPTSQTNTKKQYTGGSSPSFVILKHKVKELLNNTEIVNNQNLYNRILERLPLLAEKDIHLLLSVINSLNHKTE